MHFGHLNSLALRNSSLNSISFERFLTSFDLPCGHSNKRAAGIFEFYSESFGSLKGHFLWKLTENLLLRNYLFWLAPWHSNSWAPDKFRFTQSNFKKKRFLKSFELRPGYWNKWAMGKLEINSESFCSFEESFSWKLFSQELAVWLMFWPLE